MVQWDLSFVISHMILRRKDQVWAKNWKCFYLFPSSHYILEPFMVLPVTQAHYIFRQLRVSSIISLKV
jgi:hypothetical protein